MDTTVDFMCIGAPRAGTTWLWNVLRQHPDVWMPPIKEMHYFDRSRKYPSPSILANDRLIERVFGKGNEFRKSFLRTLKRTLLHPEHWQNLGWELRYHLGTYNDEWYLSMFTTQQEAIKGEITPSYSILSMEDIRHIHTLLPNLKIIYMLRNPVDRAWSHIKFHWTHGQLDIDNQEAVIQAIESPHNILRSDYLSVIQNWTSCFPKEQFMISFFDDIIKQPKQLLASILAFLNADMTISIPDENLFRRINESKEKNMPETIKRYLAKKYHPEVKKMVPLVGGYCEAWLKDIEASLA